MGPLGTTMVGKLQAALDPLVVDLVDESHMHSGPASETHFNLVLVSAAFEGQRLVRRHRMVYDCLQAELDAGLHALTMKTLSPGEWQAAGGVTSNPSPPCSGGSKHG